MVIPLDSQLSFVYNEAEEMNSAIQFLLGSSLELERDLQDSKNVSQHNDTIKLE